MAPTVNGHLADSFVAEGLQTLSAMRTRPTKLPPGNSANQPIKRRYSRQARIFGSTSAAR